MNFRRTFQHKVDDKVINFDVTYSPKTHFFEVYELGQSDPYFLSFDMQTRDWKITDGPAPSIPVDELALLVQKEFGFFV